MSTTFFKNFCIFCKQKKTVTEAQPATVSLSSSVLRRICPHNKSAALSFSCGSSHTVQPKIVQAKRASFMYAWSSILSAAGLAVFYIRIASRQKILVQCNVSFSAGIFLGVVLLHP